MHEPTNLAAHCHRPATGALTVMAGSAALGAEATLGGAVTESDVEMAVLVAGEFSMLAALAAGGPGVWVGLAVVLRGGAVTTSALERAVLGRLGVAAAACSSRHLACAQCLQHLCEHQGTSVHLNEAGC